MRTILIAAAAALTLGAGACSQQEAAAPEAASTTPVSTPAPAGTYAIDPNHVAVIARISHLGLSNYPVTFNKASGTLTIDPANPSAAQLEATVDLTSLKTFYTGDYRGTHAGTQFRSFEDALTRDPQMLNTAQFPSATFRSTSIAMTGANTADVTGDLTFRGVTKPVVLHATFHGGMAPGAMMPDMPAAMGFSATGTFKRSDFGFGAFMLGPNSPGLGDDIQIEIQADLTQQAAPAAAPAQ